VNAEWRATMRLADPLALYRSAASLARFEGRGHPEGSGHPRTFLYPTADGALEGADALIAAGVRVVAIPDCGHNIALDNPTGFVEAVLAHAAA
jgi:pimeloyl-ACP methyl ester carboxylesterase